VITTNQTTVGADGLLYKVEYILSTCRTRAICEKIGGVWVSPTYGSFDDIGKAFNTLFEMSACPPDRTSDSRWLSCTGERSVVCIGTVPTAQVRSTGT
jgi:hypothetical protein